MKFRPFSLNCRGRLIQAHQPLIVGILNLTPDSFYDGNKYRTTADALIQVNSMLTAGADMIDIGAMSSRPNAEIISPSVEWQRLLPVLKAALAEFPEAIFSIDTWSSSVAEQALDLGAHAINDISAARHDPRMLEIIAQEPVPFIAMHMEGTPQNMQNKPIEAHDVASEVFDFFFERLAVFDKAGLHDIIFDPGFGFGKTIAANYELLRQLHTFQLRDIPILAGLSRKSMFYKPLDMRSEDVLPATLAAQTIALQQGASLLRVHDAAETAQLRYVVSSFLTPDYGPEELNRLPQQ